MKGNFLLNDHRLAYLIHGQPVKLDYQVSRCLFVMFIDKKGRNFLPSIRFKKSKGVYNTFSNVYYPKIRMIALGWGIRFFKFGLNINFFNCRPLPYRSLPVREAQIETLNSKTPMLFLKESNQQIHLPESAKFRNHLIHYTLKPFNIRKENYQD